MEVVLIPEWHNVDKSIDMAIGILKGYDPKEKRTVAFLEALTGDSAVWYGHHTHPREGEDPLHIGEHWGQPAAPYYKLIKFLAENGFEIRGLDHSLEERQQLSRKLRHLVEDYRSEVKDYKEWGEIKPPSQALLKDLDRLKSKLTWDRETIFCDRVDKAKYEYSEQVGRIERTIVIAAPSHLKKCELHFRGTQGYSVIPHYPEQSVTELLDADERHLHLDYRFQNDFRLYDNPPLVDMAFLALNEVVPESLSI